MYLYSRIHHEQIQKLFVIVCLVKVKGDINSFHVDLLTKDRD